MSGQNKESFARHFRQAVVAFNTMFETNYPTDGVYMDTRDGLEFRPWESFPTKSLRPIHKRHAEEDFVNDSLLHRVVDGREVLYLPKDSYADIGLPESGVIYRNEPARRRKTRRKRGAP